MAFVCGVVPCTVKIDHIPKSMTLWTYQVDPSNFRMEGMLPEARKHEHRIALQPRDGRNYVNIGDLAYLCETDKRKSAG